ncbi:Elastin-binding protein EbpS [Jeotgalicoccus saudimassiliensis]|uniref:Elastin-binding protein EbpS n=1 Tax=Jeotgalicoccus saudimassiliensis TaxID=1461582 RepID=A0A078M1Q6_9STAP|nr:LysM peptidoglycan-binding domain-containing protein [Jeotgalicoccus saudimassiliensis]CEA00164.1 Elastin-binding protein EbpS [Jeotgalicoccus saudimassiliensis]
MKDDFYKDIKHKRAQDEKSSKTSAGNKKSDNEPKETLSRSARHKSKDAGDSKQPDKKVPPKKQQQKENNFTDKLKGYFTAENAAKGKALFAGTLASYQQRIKNELKISKEKLGSITAAKGTVKRPQKNSGDKDKKKRMLPWVFGVLILLPITILLAFLIFSNFWPSLNDEIQTANEGTTEETADSGNGDSGAEDGTDNAEGFNEELEAQKAEHERRLAENRNEDLSTKNIDTNYSQEELLELEEAALAAIRSKEDGSDDADEKKSDSTEPESESDTAADAEEDSDSDQASQQSESESQESKSQSQQQTETEAADSSTETDANTNSAETQNANASHVVTPEDNLYRIAIRYYGDGSAENVQRIMEANGVTPDSLSIGQELIIP